MNIMARRDAHAERAAAWAGVGGVQEKHDGCGLFVECTGTTEASVREAIEATLTSMMQSRGRDYGPMQWEISGACCHGQPVCALVIAVYESQGWDT
jgi:arginine decarboxylase